MDRLSNINPRKRISEIETELKSVNNVRKKNKLTKELKILRNIDNEGLSPIDAFTSTKIPVVPSMYRAPIELNNKVVMVPDVNELLKDVGFSAKTLEKVKKAKLPEEEQKDAYRNLYTSVKELMGFDAPTKNRKVTHNAFTTIAGKRSPKGGFLQSKVMKKRQDLSARSVLSPDPGLNIDEVTIPYDMGFKIAEPFVVEKFRGMGYKKEEIKKHIEEKTPEAKRVLQEVGNERPIMINRAPSIRKTSVNAMWPIFTERKTIGVPNLLAGLNPSLDFDGDSSISLVHMELRYHKRGKPYTRLQLILNKIYLFLKSCLKIIIGCNYGKISKDG